MSAVVSPLLADRLEGIVGMTGPGGFDANSTPHGGPIVPPQPPNDPIGPIGPIGPPENPENPSNDELSDASSSQSGFNNPDDSSDPDNSETLEYHIHTIPDQRL